jgi:hypothetical protein
MEFVIFAVFEQIYSDDLFAKSSDWATAFFAFVPCGTSGLCGMCILTGYCGSRLTVKLRIIASVSDRYFGFTVL